MVRYGGDLVDAVTADAMRQASALRRDWRGAAPGQAVLGQEWVSRTHMSEDANTSTIGHPAATTSSQPGRRVDVGVQER